MKHHVTLKQIERELRAMGLLEDWRTEQWIAKAEYKDERQALKEFLHNYGLYMGKDGRLHQSL
ncbi:MAG: hypothetical protein KatS3mg023_3853 [Armatimonadota bacterium]|nr:MAG: hypothetical protein KatS3mg023_2247 [Armatimonadota bacterium]GIV22102.1 MAG: hypothetical protein KatS3mg023_3853 [Armatimonadota bacterium]